MANPWWITQPASPNPMSLSLKNSIKRGLTAIAVAIFLLLASGIALFPILTTPTFDAAANMWLYNDQHDPIDAWTKAPEIEAWLLSENRIELNMGTLSKEITAKEIANNLTVAPAQINQVQVRFTHPDPILAAWVSNTYSDVIQKQFPQSVNLHSEDAVPNLSKLKAGDGALLLSGLGGLLAGVLLIFKLGNKKAVNAIEIATLATAAILLLIAAAVRSPGFSLTTLFFVSLMASGIIGWRWLVGSAVMLAALPEGIFSVLFPVRILTFSLLGVLGISGILLLLSYRKPIVSHRASIISIAGLLALPLWALASSPISLLPKISFQHSVVALVFITFFVLIWTQRWHDYSIVKDDLAAVIAAGMLVILVPIFTIAASPAKWALSPTSGRFQFLWANPNTAGLICAVIATTAASFALVPSKTRSSRLKSIAIWGSVALISGTAATLTGSRGALLGMVCSIFLIAIGLLRKQHAFLLLGGILISLTGAVLIVQKLGLFHRRGATGIDSGRYDLWREAISRWSQSPLTGIGYRVGTSAGPSATYHNLYATLLTELGVIGLILALIAAVGLILSARGACPRLIAPLATIAIAEIFDSSLVGFLGPTALICWLVIIGRSALGSHKTISTP
ncbi:MAG: O-antigen ligase family protein [Propionibacteriaceae bacterium]